MDDRSANPRATRPRHSRDDVVDAALGLLDDQGLPGLTMRRLADVLGVQPSALYWHFDSKQALLAAVSGRILAPIAATGSNAPSLQTEASTLGTQLRDRLLAYRDGAELVSSSLALGLVAPPLHAALAATARRLGRPESLATTAAEAITHFVVGYTFHEQQRMQAETLGVLGAPNTLTPEDAAGPRRPATDDFGSALGLIVTGLDTPREHKAHDAATERS
ncbi:TetR family transcriptional regulator [Myceligenerans pegani]|uniref:TetR family transcriptional regulator n=1 Tax=Myceligenerans pegani TaxID=2776917 RepID=A0ABR9N621_9MICO|nr:TetR family transcriptional regulator [Myceligenerans sp. TRM 65318]MBE1878467.1 TetR family transcriptional regulator [Myceligenerans sp. TRM 65318]MBE3020738.1 TetR family transcriptional regulator [Myceligenerans sp. TRM 65318]